MTSADYDLLIVGGGINGTGIARDAAGRGLRVLLVERDDLASHTSSASTKLVHGGLRYLEYYEFRLVRESLIERERLMSLAPHLITPLRFVMPMPPDGRPAWLIRMGLFLYDHIGGRRSLPGSRGVTRGDGVLDGLDAKVARGFEYSDCWVDDARLVALNAVGAREKGAEVWTRTAFLSAKCDGGSWIATLRGRDGDTDVRARILVNAAGPWVGEVLRDAGGTGQARAPRLVKGSHIIVPRRLPGDHAFILQNPDKRIVFAIPYERDFTLIGTTDVPFDGDAAAPMISDDELAYLCESANRYLAEPIAPVDVIHSYSGVRPLYDDGREEAASVTRDYVLELDTEGGAPLLSVFGGKITTYRRLAEHALEKLAAHTGKRASWTGTEPLPGGDFAGGLAAAIAANSARWAFLPPATVDRMTRAYGSRVERVIGDAASLAGMGEDFGGGLTAREVDYLLSEEWAVTAEDILWRRTKIGLHTGAETARRLRAYLREGG